MTRDELKQYLLRRLGFDKVQVEISDLQLDDAIDDAIMYLSEYLGFYGSVIYTVDSSLSHDFKTDGINYRISHVLQSSKLTDNIGDYTIGQVLNGYGVDFQGGGILDLEGRWVIFNLSFLMQLQNLFNTIRRIGGYITWVYDTNQQIITFTDGVEVGDTMLSMVRFGYSEVEDYQFRDLKLLKDLSYAYACRRLARVWGKYSSLPGLDSDVTLNYSDLISDAETIEQKIEEEMNGYTIPFVIKG